DCSFDLGDFHAGVFDLISSSATSPNVGALFFVALRSSMGSTPARTFRRASVARSRAVANETSGHCPRLISLRRRLIVNRKPQLTRPSGPAIAYRPPPSAVLVPALDAANFFVFSFPAMLIDSTISSTISQAQPATAGDTVKQS